MWISKGDQNLFSQYSAVGSNVPDNVELAREALSFSCPIYLVALSAQSRHRSRHSVIQPRDNVTQSLLKLFDPPEH